MAAIAPRTPSRSSPRGEPAWELAELFPLQGEWTETAYLRIWARRVVELVDGCLEIPPHPDLVHQLLVLYLTNAANRLKVDDRNGTAIQLPFRLKIPNGNWRVPDVSYLAPQNMHRFRRDWWDHADLTVEVVSPDDPDRNYVRKRVDYAAVGVREFWIVDPLDRSVAILVLDGDAYREAQVARTGDVARSVMFPSLAVDVREMFITSRADPPQTAVDGD